MAGSRVTATNEYVVDAAVDHGSASATGNRKRMGNSVWGIGMDGVAFSADNALVSAGCTRTVHHRPIVANRLLRSRYADQFGRTHPFRRHHRLFLVGTQQTRRHILVPIPSHNRYKPTWTN